VLRISLKRAECIGCGNCKDVAPRFWVMDQVDGQARLIGSEQKNGLNVLLTEEFDEELFQKAAVVCPVRIIRVEILKNLR